MLATFLKENIKHTFGVFICNCKLLISQVNPDSPSISLHRLGLINVAVNFPSQSQYALLSINVNKFMQKVLLC